MSWKRKIQGGILGFVGFMLSPLSWWNDAFVNLPLAIAFGWLVDWIYPPAFAPAVVIAYWMTNVLGLVLMQKGARRALSKEEPRSYSARQLGIDLLISLAYTLLILALLKFGILKPLAHYFPTPPAN